VNGILKGEYLNHQEITSFYEGYRAVEKAVFIYNYKRPHMSCDMLSPQQAHEQSGKLKRRWKNYYQKKQESTILVNKK
jgi:transposase InsO family protein